MKRRGFLKSALIGAGAVVLRKALPAPPCAGLIGGEVAPQKRYKLGTPQWQYVTIFGDLWAYPIGIGAYALQKLRGRSDTVLP